MTSFPVRFLALLAPGFRKRSQWSDHIISWDTLLITPGLSMHFKYISCDHLCLDFLTSYFGTLASPEHEYDWMTEAITLFMSEQEMEANGKDINGNSSFNHNLCVAQHSLVGIDCFGVLTQSMPHNVHILGLHYKRSNAFLTTSGSENGQAQNIYSCF